MVIKNRHGILGLGTLKSALSKERIEEMSCFLHADSNLGQLKVTLIIIGWSWSKMGESL